MSLGIYPVFTPKLRGTKLDVLGEVLARNFQALDEIAGTAKLKPLTAFADNRSIPEGFDGDPDELAEILGEWTEWFDPADGESVIQALTDHIKASPKAAKRLDDAIGLTEELQALARVLAVAEIEGIRFRLEMS